MFIFVCPFLYLSVWGSACVSVSLSLWQSICLFVFVWFLLYLFTAYPLDSLSVRLLGCYLFIIIIFFVSVYPSVCLSVYLSPCFLSPCLQLRLSTRPYGLYVYLVVFPCPPVVVHPINHRCIILTFSISLPAMVQTQAHA